MNLPFMKKHNRMRNLTLYFTESGMVNLDDFMNALSMEESVPEYDGRWEVYFKMVWRKEAVRLKRVRFN